MPIVKNLNTDKEKTLHNIRDKIIELIFNNPKKCLDEELFEELCNNEELTYDDVD